MTFSGSSESWGNLQLEEWCLTQLITTFRKEAGCGEWDPLQSSQIKCSVLCSTIFIFSHTCIIWRMMFSYDLLMWPRGEAKHVIKRNSWGRLQDWLVILGPCLESLLSQTQRGTVSSQTVARAVVFNYGQAVEIETVTIWFCGCCFLFLFQDW